MSEPINQNPELAPGMRQAKMWQSIFIYGFAALAIIVLVHFRFSSAGMRAYQPGQWVGAAPFLEGLGHFSFILFCLVLSAYIAVAFRRFGSILLLAGIFVAFTFLGFYGHLPPKPSTRYSAELPLYKWAIETGAKYGDQFSEESAGRTLTYWRWMTWDLDNAIGVIYDPADRLAKENDFMAFRGPATGTIFRIEKIEPKWYFVEHS